MRFTGVLALLGVTGTLACGGDDNPTDPGDGADQFTVSVVNNAFNPGSISVPVNSTVTWQWNSGGVAHNVTFEDGTGNSSSMTSGTHQRTFGQTGDYAYVCTIHPGMAGAVSVTTTATGGTGGGGTGTGGGGGGGGYP
jgi:plastocyanin